MAIDPKKVFQIAGGNLAMKKKMFEKYRLEFDLQKCQSLFTRAWKFETVSSSRISLQNFRVLVVAVSIMPSFLEYFYFILKRGCSFPSKSPWCQPSKETLTNLYVQLHYISSAPEKKTTTTSCEICLW